MQLRCTIHFKRNLEEKLRTKGYSLKAVTELMEGCHNGTKEVVGLADTENEEEFGMLLSKLKDKWNIIDNEYLSSKEPYFHPYFCKYHKKVVKYLMRQDIRESAGLGSSPAYFTANAAEPINSALKQKLI